MNKTIPVCEPMLDGNELNYVMEAMKSGWISSAGKYVVEFEERFARYCDTKYGIAVCNGTVAIHLALAALGIGKGDEVIIPSFTMIATAFAVCYTGAMPVFVDAEFDTWNIDIEKIEEKITHKTKAIMPVHIFGNPCNMEVIGTLCQKYGLYLVEDAAEAHGALYRGSKVGSFSTVAAFSFFANKNVTTGEGGMVVTSDESISERCRYLKNMCFPHDRPRTYEHEDIGFNYRMSNLHAAIGLAQTEKADQYRSMRILNGEYYKKLLSSIPGVRLQKDQEDSLNVHWMNGIVIDSDEYGADRDSLIQYLKDKGIDTRLFFVGMHRQKALEKYGCDMSGGFPVSDRLASTGFYLPSGSSLNHESINYICEKIDSFPRAR